MGAAAVLKILKDGEEIKSLPLEGESVLGRSQDCVIRIDDRAISRQHAVLRPVSGGVQIEKKSEFAPLSVNGNECTSAIVKEGDVVSIGPYEVKLVMNKPEPTPSSDSPQPPQALPSVEAVPIAQPVQEIPTAMTTSGSGAIPDLEMDSGPSADALVLETEAPPQAGAEGEGIVALEPHDSGGPGQSEPVPEMPAEIPTPDSMGFLEASIPSIGEDGNTRVASPSKISAKLVFPTGVANTTEFELAKDEVSIGRGKECDVVLDDKRASRKHAIIRRTGASFSIKDLDSANGTYVNDSKIQEQELSGDDIIRIGNAEFRFLALSADYVRNEQDFMPVPQEQDAGSPEPMGMPQSSPSRMQPGLSSSIPGMQAPPIDNGTGGVAGLAGIGGVTGKKQSLFQKYRALPPRRKVIWTVVLIALFYFLIFDEDPAPKKQIKAKPAVTAASKTTATFESLTPEQQKFVESQHSLAFDYYRNHEYDKAIFEIEKIFTLIPDYKDSREIERYAKEGKRKLEALEEEKHKKEEEEKLRLHIAELVDDAKNLMDKKKYDQVSELFSQILALDPDNQQVADWKKVVDTYMDQQRIEEEQKEVQQQINARAWDIYNEGVDLKNRKKYIDALSSFRRVAQIGATDKRVERSAAARIDDIHKLISGLRDPVLAEAKQDEDSQDYANAFKLYEKAAEIDPSDSTAYAGMDRIRGVLHERAKTLYIDAVLAESYTDFELAKKKFLECLSVAPKDDIYHDRAERKLAALFGANGAGAAPAPDTSAGSSGGDANSGGSP